MLIYIEISMSPENIESHKIAIKQMTLIDGDLKLVLAEIKEVTPPDNHLKAYYFNMVNSITNQKMGGINIKAGYTKNIELFRGNIGFVVNKEFQGHHYASRSCKILIPVIKLLSLNPIWLTCDIDNIASSKSIESIGAIYVGTETIPDDDENAKYYPIGSRSKRRYKWEPCPLKLPKSQSRL